MWITHFLSIMHKLSETFPYFSERTKKRRLDRACVEQVPVA
jgi:hypothetical protein